MLTEIFRSEAIFLNFPGLTRTPPAPPKNAHSIGKAPHTVLHEQFCHFGGPMNEQERLEAERLLGQAKRLELELARQRRVEFQTQQQRPDNRTSAR